MFRTGFARCDITPPLGFSLAGYFEKRIADGVRDPLELNAVAFDDGENKAVLITSDLIYVMENVATRLRREISEATGIREDFIFTQGLHQHTSIRIGHKVHLTEEPDPNDSAYLTTLHRKFVDVTRLAIRDLAESRIGIAEAETAEPIAFIRRYRMRDGSVRTNPGTANPDVVAPEGKADNTVRLIRLFREGAKDIAIVNFSTHPDTIGGNQYSADWPGFVRRLTEADLKDVHCILVNGAQGDSNHVDISKKRIVDHDARYEGYTRRMGRIITDVVLGLWENTAPAEAGKVWGKVKMEYVPTNQSGKERLEEYREINRRIQSGEITWKDVSVHRAEVGRVLQLHRELIAQKVPVSFLGIGKIVFVGFGGEPFMKYAENAREDGAGFYVITACCTNGGQGYLPTEEAYGQGSYEVSNSRFSSCVESMLRLSAKEMIETYRNLIG